MADERWEFRALRLIANPAGGWPAYNIGDGLMAQVVDDWGLEVGTDVEPARTDSVPLPTTNAPRAVWERYALIQGLSRGEVDGMTVADLRQRFTPDDSKPNSAAVKAAAKKGA
jgi:hypothetical protein